MAGLDTDGLEALSYFQRFLPRAYAFQAPLAFAASASALAHFVAGATDTYITAPSGRFTVDSADSRVGWLMCGLLMGAQLPYSFKVLMPLNRQLLLHDAQKQPREWKSAKIVCGAICITRARRPPLPLSESSSTRYSGREIAAIDAEE